MNDLTKIICKEVGNKIRELRRQYGKTQAELAEELGITRNMVAQYENGISNMPQSVLIKVANYFDVTVDELLNAANDVTEIKKEIPVSENVFNDFKGVQFSDGEQEEIRSYLNFILYKRGAK